MKPLTTSQAKTTKSQASNESYSRFLSFAQKIVNVPKKEIDDQEKKYQMRKMEEEAKD